MRQKISAALRIKLIRTYNTKHTIFVTELNKGVDFATMTSMLYFKGDTNFGSKNISAKNVYYAQK